MCVHVNDQCLSTGFKSQIDGIDLNLGVRDLRHRGLVSGSACVTNKTSAPTANSTASQWTECEMLRTFRVDERGLKVWETPWIENELGFISHKAANVDKSIWMLKGILNLVSTAVTCLVVSCNP
jgi:hypothetical protein